MADFDKLAELLESQATVATFAKALKGHSALKHASNIQGDTLLHLATAQGRIEVIKFLLEQHAPIAAANKEGQTALHLAALSTDPAPTKALLSEVESIPNKAQVAVLNAKDAELGRTALHYASKLGCEATLQLLLQAGADPDILTQTKHSALRSAAAQGHSAAVDALIAGKAKVNIPDAKGVNALHAAASIGSMDVVSALLAGVDSQDAVQACDSGGCSVLHYAISSGMTTTLLNLVKCHPHHANSFRCNNTTHQSCTMPFPQVRQHHCSILYYAICIMPFPKLPKRHCSELHDAGSSGPRTTLLSIEVCHGCQSCSCCLAPGLC